MIFAVESRRLLGALLLSLGGVPAASALTLGEAFDRALKQDPLVPMSWAEFQGNQLRGREERGSLLPRVDLEGQYDLARTKAEMAFGEAPGEVYQRWQGSIIARQPVFRGDWFDRLDRAGALDREAKLIAETHRLGLMRRLADRYFQVLLAQDAVTHAEAEARVLRGSLEDTRKRYSVELVPGTDLKEAQARDDLAQARVLVARRNLDTAREALEEAVGPVAVLPGLPEDRALPALAPAAVDGWIALAHEHSPILGRAREAVVIAKADYQSRRAEALPAVDLVAEAGYFDSSDYALGQTQEDQRLGLQLTVPIYSGGVRQARIGRSEWQLRRTEADLARETLQLERSIRQLFREVQTRYAENDALARALGSALAAEQATRAGYEAGTRTITDVLDAQSRVMEARRDLNSSRYTLLLTLIQLKQSAGVLVLDDFAAIDRLLTLAPNS